VQSGMPGSVPGYLAAQEQPAASTSAGKHPTLPVGIIAPTAPVPGDIPPLLSGSQPLSAESQHTPVSMERHESTSAAHSPNGHTLNADFIVQPSAVPTQSLEASASGPNPVKTVDQSTILVSSVPGTPGDAHAEPNNATISSKTGVNHTDGDLAVATSIDERKEEILASSMYRSDSSSGIFFAKPSPAAIPEAPFTSSRHVDDLRANANKAL
jgi:hypothetical protein